MLAIQVDDVVDELEEASDLLALYGIELPTKHAVQRMRSSSRPASASSSPATTSRGSSASDALVELKQFEDKGDRSA